ncbi:MAG: hypothetical protein CL917_01690 [Deltaproteobacteria bacterium]|nr:hypothetical protein [Deltaproteobacteria bacterium]
MGSSLVWVGLLAIPYVPEKTRTDRYRTARGPFFDFDNKTGVPLSYPANDSSFRPVSIAKAGAHKNGLSSVPISTQRLSVDQVYGAVRSSHLRNCTGRKYDLPLKTLNSLKFSRMKSAKLRFTHSP